MVGWEAAVVGWEDGATESVVAAVELLDEVAVVFTVGPKLGVQPFVQLLSASFAATTVPVMAVIADLRLTVGVWRLAVGGRNRIGQQRWELVERA